MSTRALLAGIVGVERATVTWSRRPTRDPGRLRRAELARRRPPSTCRGSTTCALDRTWRSPPRCCTSRKPGPTSGGSGCTTVARRCPIADLLPLLDQLGFRAIDERAFQFDLERSARHRRLVARRRGVGAEASLLAEESRAEVQRAFVAEFTDTVEVDGLNRLVLLAGLTRTSGRGAARVRALPAPDRVPVQSAVHRVDAVPPRVRSAAARRAVRVRFDPDLGRDATTDSRAPPAPPMNRWTPAAPRDRRGARRRAEPRRRPHAARRPGADRRDGAHQRVPAATRRQRRCR